MRRLGESSESAIFKFSTSDAVEILAARDANAALEDESADSLKAANFGS
jgi:hypothetical protein